MFEKSPVFSAKWVSAQGRLKTAWRGAGVGNTVAAIHPQILIAESGLKRAENSIAAEGGTGLVKSVVAFSNQKDELSGLFKSTG
mmetsp:Transcript_18692/g.29782  ORF Transcript_18692/g.29782 Transcript_18692/m.29782 type:complete len:84 (-) Transcript_18692:39-290(-)